jgi:hypothetical protein
MKRWLLVPFAMCALVIATPSSQGAGWGRKSCDSYSAPCQTIVGYKTEVREVTVYESAIEKRKINVTEYKTEAEKRKVTVHKVEKVKETRAEKFWVCEPIITEEVREYTVYNRVESKATGVRKVCRPIITEEIRKYTVDVGHYETHQHEVACYSRSRGCCKKGCDDGCVTYKTVCHKVWVPKFETREAKVKVTKYETVEEKYDYIAVTCVPEKKAEKVKVTRFQKVEKVRNVDYWFCKTTPVVEEITVNVCKPITVEKIIDVRVCVPVKKKVEVKVPIYGVVECAAPAPAPCYTSCDSGCGRRRGCCK